MITLDRKCPITGKTSSMELPMTKEQYEAAFDAWYNGALIQDAFHVLTPEEREFVKTGIIPEVWESLFGEDI